MIHKCQSCLSSSVSSALTGTDWLVYHMMRCNDNVKHLKLSYKKLLGSVLLSEMLWSNGSQLLCFQDTQQQHFSKLQMAGNRHPAERLQRELGEYAFWQKGLPSPGMPPVLTALPVPWLFRAQNKLWIRGTPVNLMTSWHAGILSHNKCLLLFKSFLR